MQFKCMRCLECCRQYWISLLPEEAEKISRKLNLSLKEFIEKNCVVLLQAYPFSKSKQSFVHSLDKFPSRIQGILKKKSKASHFMVLPLIALDKTKGKCILLKGVNCLVYEERPKQCALFPLISIQRTKTSKEHYPFCKGLLPGKEFKINKKEVLGHYEKVRNHLDEVKEKGFQSIWPALPAKGMLMLSNEFIDELKKGEFIELI